MTIRSLSCPKCRTAINAPQAMLTIRCPACANVFAATAGAMPDNAPLAESGEDTPDDQSSKETDSDSVATDPNIIYLAVAGVFALMIMFGMIGFLVVSPTNSEIESKNPKPTTPVFHQATAEELASLTIVDVPEEERRRIYDDMRVTARMTTEKQLIVPGGGVRQKLEGMLDSTYENSIQQLAALHDLRMDDVRNIVREGNMKNWDTRARSNAQRDGQRVYDEENSYGYKTKKPI